ncbi:MAG: hypothetical protein WC824_14380 [Bacteroidota bacterium]|jgi:hypothetical protein
MRKSKIPLISEVDPHTLPMVGEEAKTNIFGGGNPHGVYVPLTEDEQEVLQRIVDSKDVELVIHDWAVLSQPNITFGDLRVCVKFRLNFGPGRPTPVRYFDLELRFASGEPIFRQKLPVEINGQPVMVGHGVGVDFLDLAWDIAIDHMDPAFVKRVKPGAFGLTSRRLDRDTKERTFSGNMKLTNTQSNWLEVIDKGAEEIRAEDAKRIDAAIEKSHVG